MPLIVSSAHSRGSAVVAGVVAGAFVVTGAVVCAFVVEGVAVGFGVVAAVAVVTLGTEAGLLLLLIKFALSEVSTQFKDITTANVNNNAPPMPMSVSVDFPKIFYSFFVE